MAKADKAIPEEISIEAAPAVIQETSAAEPVETYEEREARLKREDYARRNAEAIKDRERIFRENGLIGPDETLTMDTEAAIAQRCCI